ncbi:unnamed protein product, partial [Mesorhabditis spiculigera]
MPCCNVAHWRMRAVTLGITFLLTGSINNCADVFNSVRLNIPSFPRNGQVIEGSIYDDPNDVEWLISWMGLGSLFGIVPFAMLYQRFGARYVLFISGITCSVVTALLPSFLETNYFVSAVLRFIQGITFAADFGVIGYVASQWSSMSGLGMSLAILSGFIALRDVVQQPINYFMAKSDWAWNIYVMAILAFTFSIIWVIVYRDMPIDSPWISEDEILRINEGKSLSHVEGKMAVPIRKAFNDWRMWGLWAAAFIDTFTAFFWMLYAPDFFEKLGFDLKQRATLVMSLGVSFLAAKFITGFLSDHARCVSQLVRVRVSAFFCFLGPALASFMIPLTTHYTAYVMLLIFVCLTGTNVGGFYKACLLMYRQYSYFVVGTLQVFKTLSLILSPVLKSLVASDGALAQYHVVSFGFGVALLIGLALLLASASDEKRYWVEDEDEKPIKEKHPITP